MLRLARAVILAAIGGVLVYTHAGDSGKNWQSLEMVVGCHAAKLDVLVPEIRFDNTPLNQAIDTLREATGANLVVDWQALEAFGVDRERGVTLKLQKQALWRALDRMFVSASSTVILDFMPCDHGAVRISTREAMRRAPLVARLYDVREIAEGPGREGMLGGLHGSTMTRICQMIRMHIFPDEWDTRDTPIVAAGNYVLAVQTPVDQLKIEAFVYQRRQFEAAVRGEMRPPPDDADLLKRW